MRRRDFIVAALLTSTVLAACGAEPGPATGNGSPSAGNSSPASTNTTPAARPAGEPIVKVASDPTLGQHLTDPKGMTLYYFTMDEDPSGSSRCTGLCAETFPPYVVPEGTPLVLPEGMTGTLALHKRQEGTLQVVYNDILLYYYAKDTQPGDAKGNELNYKYFVIKPGDTFKSISK